jgi:hypothetical protein
MPLPNGCAPNRILWRQILANIDTLLSKSLGEYERANGGFSDSSLADAYRQFAGLGRRGKGGGADPDYGQSAVPFVYVPRFVPQRMTTIVCGLDVLSKCQRFTVDPPSRVLDFGNGTGVVSLTLETTNFVKGNHAIHCIDSSAEMIEMSAMTSCKLNRVHVADNGNEFIGQYDGENFDAIFPSYALDYEYERGGPLVEKLVDRLHQVLASDGFILYSGPEGKSGIAQTPLSRLNRTHGLGIVDLSFGWPDHLRVRYSMPKLQELYDGTVARARLGGLDDGLYNELLNPYTGKPSWVFTHTSDKQRVFAAISCRGHSL